MSVVCVVGVAMSVVCVVDVAMSVVCGCYECGVCGWCCY